MRTIVKEKKHFYIVSNKEICGGSPIIKNTRITVWSIIKWYKIGFSIEEILREFPQLTPSQIHDAFSYYYDNKESIEKEIEENENELCWRNFAAGKQ